MAVTVRGLPSRSSSMVTFEPGAIAPTTGGKSLDSWMAWPLMLRITSRRRMPARAAGLSGCTLSTSAPLPSAMPSALASARPIGWITTPNCPRVTLPVAFSCCTAFIATSIGMAKLTPM